MGMGWNKWVWIVATCLSLTQWSANVTAQISSASATTRIFHGTGNHHRAVTTEHPEAQRWFDQGMRFLYGFNHDEAIRSFEQAASLDPECPMAWWGIAYASGFHINNPEMSEEQSRKAWEAAQAALRCQSRGTPVEQAFIDAIVQRYAWPAPDDRAGLDLAYATAMGLAFESYPLDADLGALYAEALMDLQPWDLWTHDGKPKGRALEIVQTLESVLTMAPDHPGANHFYIHAVEASPWPGKALAAADRLRTLCPGMGHLVHMPAHIYIRTGRYADAAQSNMAAIAADRAYFQDAAPPDFYFLYFAHNLHFLAYACMMEGRFHDALQAARELEKSVPSEFWEKHAEKADGLAPVTFHVFIRFGKWQEILDEPAPPDYRLISRAVRHYARGIAFANLKQFEDAERELHSFNELANQIGETWFVGNNPAEHVIKIARGMLEGELAFHQGRSEETWKKLREAVELEDQLAYDEPPGWMQPVRHALGALLLSAGRHVEAVEVYRADLEHHPNNGWSLLGLAQAWEQSGNMAEAQLAKEAWQAAWSRADVQPHASCYCRPRP